jgi:hypothetical protein
LSAAVALAAALTFGARPVPAQEFKTVEAAVEEGWDISALDERIRAAVTKAEAPGAGARERRAAAAAFLARANVLRDLGAPAFYKFALGDFRRALRFEPGNAEAREKADEIIHIYRSMRRPVPEQGNASPGGGYTVEMFRTTPRRVEFGPGGLFRDERPKVSALVAHTYEFDARAGQTLSADLAPKAGRGAVFDLLLRDHAGARRLAEGARSGRYVLPSEGKYLLRVYSKREPSGYELRASLR